jgi:hypothetical protein
MPDQVPKTQAEIEADEIIRERVIKNAGINRPEVLNYAVRLTKTIVGAPGQLTIAVFAINTATTILPALSGVAVSHFLQHIARGPNSVKIIGPDNFSRSARDDSAVHPRYFQFDQRCDYVRSRQLRRSLVWSSDGHHEPKDFVSCRGY